MKTKDYSTVSIWLSNREHALLKRLVAAANKARPEVRFNVSMVVRALVTAYANGGIEAPPLPVLGRIRTPRGPVRAANPRRARVVGKAKVKTRAVKIAKRAPRPAAAPSPAPAATAPLAAEQAYPGEQVTTA